jgi:glyoxylase-like metal-dependent hydrolase (beta-lactamase superfamily II)
MQFRFWPYQYDESGARLPVEVEAASILPDLWYVGDHRYCCYLVRTGQGLVMIDTGVEDQADYYLSQIRRAGGDPTHLVALLHTHAHHDHIGATPRLLSISGALAIIGAADAPQLAQRAPVNRMLCPKEVVSFADTDFTFCHTPGHTIGCGMYLTDLGGSRVCFVGDAAGPHIFAEFRWQGDAEAFRASAARMKEVEADLYLPGHPHQTLEVSPEGDPRLSRDQWHRYIDQRVRIMEETIAEARS